MSTNPTIDIDAKPATSTNKTTKVDEDYVSISRSVNVDTTLTRFPRSQKPTKGSLPIYTEERRNIILDCLSNGLSIVKASLAAGIDEKTIRNWFKRDKRFANDCAIVRAKSENELASLIRRADKSTAWQAWAWLLERGYGWVPRQEITGKDGGALIQTTISKETLAKIAKLAGPEEIKKIN